jgi:MFS family permease
MLVLSALTAVMSAGYGAMFSLLGEFRDQYGIAESRLGLIVGVGFVAGFASQILIAPLADRGHARRVVIGGALLYVAGTAMLGLATSFAPMIAGRCVMGVGVGAASPAIKRIVIVTDQGRLGHSLGVILSAEVGGFAAGPAVSALLAGHFGLSAPFITIAVVNAILLLPMLALVVGETRAAQSGPRLAIDLLRARPFVAAVMLGSAVFVMIGVFDALWSVAMKDLHSPRWLSSLGISLFALPIVVFGAAGGRLAQRIGPFRLGVAGLAFATACVTGYGLVGSGVAMFAVAMVHSSADAFTLSSSSVAAGMVVPADRQAGAHGVLGGAQTLLAGISSAVAGVLYEHLGRTSAYLVGAGMMTALWVAGAWLARPVWSRTAPRT